MKLNERGADRAVRVIAGIALLAVAYFYLMDMWAIVAAAVGAVMLVTGVIGVCPAYSIFGIATCPRTAKSN